MTVPRVFIVCFLFVCLTWTSSGMSIGRKIHAGNENLRAKRSLRTEVDSAKGQLDNLAKVMPMLTQPLTVVSGLSSDAMTEGVKQIKAGGANLASGDSAKTVNAGPSGDSGDSGTFGTSGTSGTAGAAAPPATG